MTDKSPISILQEYVVGNFIGVPNYNTDSQMVAGSASFTCYCQCNNETVMATASSKKEAKHRAAVLMLQKLGIASSNQISYIKNVNTSRAMQPQDQTFNSIGALNEYCSKNRFGYAQYQEMGIENGKFAITCHHQSLVTKGLASTKKEAKQASAAAMMKLVISKEPNHSASRTPEPLKPSQSIYKMPVALDTNEFVCKMPEALNPGQSVYKMPEPLKPKPMSMKMFYDDEVISQYKKLCFKNQLISKQPCISNKINDPFEEENPSENNNYSTNNFSLPERHDSKHSKADRELTQLEDKLRARQVSYSVKALDDDNCSLMLTTKVPFVDTFMAIGDSKIDAMIQLLQQLDLKTNSM